MKHLRKGKPWTNWARTFACIPGEVFYPSSIDDVCSIVKEAKKQKKTIRVFGAGHSFTPLVKNEEILISLDLLSGIESIDEVSGTVTVYGGTRLYQIGEELGKRGYAQENLGDINVQSIAGAISTGTHGTGLQFGNLSTQVKEIVLVTTSGEILTISEKQNAKYFKAALISLGCLGIIVKVTLHIIRCPIYHYKSQQVLFPQLVEQLEQWINSNRHFEFYLFPYSDLVQVKTMNISEQQPQQTSLHHLKNLVLENYLYSIICEICRLFPKSCRFFSRLSARLVGSSSIVSYSYKLFATPRLVVFREMEYAIPLQYLRQAILEVVDRIEAKQYNVHFPIEVRTVKADDILLSPAYQRDSAYIAFHMYNGMPYEEYFHDMEQIMRKYEGRPHWGKMHNLGKKDLMKLYPKLSEFLQIRSELDPDGIFLNDYLREMWGLK